MKLCLSFTQDEQLLVLKKSLGDHQDVWLFFCFFFIVKMDAAFVQSESQHMELRPEVHLAVVLLSPASFFSPFV